MEIFNAASAASEPDSCRASLRAAGSLGTILPMTTRRSERKRDAPRRALLFKSGLAAAGFDCFSNRIAVGQSVRATRVSSMFRHGGGATMSVVLLPAGGFRSVRFRFSSIRDGVGELGTGVGLTMTTSFGLV